MYESEEIKIIFKKDDDYEFEEEKGKPDDHWPDLYDEIIRALATPEHESAEESTSIEEKKSIETIITISSDDIGDVPSIGSAKSLTHPCLKHISLSDSQLKFLDIYKFYPIPEDPGIKEAFWKLYPHTTCYEADGVDKYFDVARALGAIPISSMKNQLTSDEVNLRYYGVEAESVRAICEALFFNSTVKSLDLQDSKLSDETCYYLNKLLLRNIVLSSLNLRSCQLGVKGARRLEEGISLSSALTDLNLSHCELGNEGFQFVAKAVAVNTLLKSLDVSNNNLDEDSANSLYDMLLLTDSLKRLNLSWNYFNTKLAAEKLFSGLGKNSSLIDVDLSWNSMSKSSVFYLTRYIINSKTIEILNIEANRFSDNEAASIGRALIQNRSLKELHLSKNPIGSTGISGFINYLSSNKFIDSPLTLLNLESYWASKDALPVLDQLKEDKPKLTIKLAGILENFQIIGPDLKELYFKIANYEAMLPKKKKEKKNFGHFILSLPDSNITKEKFMDLVTDFKIKVSDSLVKEMMKQFLVTKKSLSQAALKKAYMEYFPECQLPPPPPPPKVEEAKKDKKGKKSKSKKGSPKKTKDKSKKKK